MIALLQRVTSAKVTAGERLLGEIGSGLLVLLGVLGDDDGDQAGKLAAKTAKLRIFADEDGKMNRSLLDSGGSILAVSQFTLCADVRSGNRPSFAKAAKPELARPLFEEYVRALEGQGVPTETGEFGAMMQVELVNDGPVTVWLDSREL